MTALPHRPGLHRLRREIHSPGSIATLRIPHLVAIGARPGPTSAVVAGQHGREVAGMMAAAEAFQRLDPNTLAGSVHVFPSLNPLALQLGQQDFPLEDSRYRVLPLSETANMDRLWNKGSGLDPITTATTSQIWENPLRDCGHILDLHCWSSYFCPMAWAHERDETLLRQVGFPFLTLRPDSSSAPLGTLRECAWQTRQPIVVVELPGQNTVSPEALSLGVATVRNFLIAAGHLDEAPQPASSQILLHSSDPESMQDLPIGGMWHPKCQVGQVIEEGAVLGEVWSPETFAPLTTIRAAQGGLLLFNGPPIWGEDHREHQIVHPGQRISKIKTIRQRISPSESC